MFFLSAYVCVLIFVKIKVYKNVKYECKFLFVCVHVCSYACIYVNDLQMVGVLKVNCENIE